MYLTAKNYARIFGVIFVLVGVVGFFLTGFSGFAATDGPVLILFQVNPLHNIVHLLLGAIYLIGSRGSEAGARAVVFVLSLAYLAVGVVGLFVIDTNANIVAVNQADNFLHIGTGLLGLIVAGISAARERQTPATA
jgi:hypothetical protein